MTTANATVASIRASDQIRIHNLSKEIRTQTIGLRIGDIVVLESKEESYAYLALP